MSFFKWLKRRTTRYWFFSVSYTQNNNRSRVNQNFKFSSKGYPKYTDFIDFVRKHIEDSSNIVLLAYIEQTSKEFNAFWLNIDDEDDGGERITDFK